MNKVFTDEDLKRLADLFYPGRGYIGDSEAPLTMDGLRLLLHRLECAEMFIAKSFMPIEWEGHPDYKAWISSKGG